MKLTILGCGGSGGVPSIGDNWGACDQKNPKNHRLRPSILVSHGDTTVLVDTSPDMRQQLLATKVSTLDGVLYTHTHADHIHGIDDLRPINHNMKRAIDIYASRQSLEEMERRFAYVLEPLDPRAKGHFYKPSVTTHEIDGPFAIGPITVTPFTQSHCFVDTLGFRFDANGASAAYSTDVVALDDSAFDVLEGVEAWIVGCLRLRPHVTHAHLDLALEWIARVKPRRAILTHMNYDMDYNALAALLPPGVEPAYDTMVLEV
ncbi:MAG: MBL fold metallo-hydrolase [Alphaproteobacteria bacterium]|nr:MBL fold metallo-hydrolase [Alphaproteobacteria bacterium]